jgi:hypothetical protein
MDRTSWCFDRVCTNRAADELRGTVTRVMLPFRELKAFLSKGTGTHFLSMGLLRAASPGTSWFRPGFALRERSRDSGA